MDSRNIDSKNKMTGIVIFGLLNILIGLFLCAWLYIFFFILFVAPKYTLGDLFNSVLLLCFYIFCGPLLIYANILLLKKKSLGITLTVLSFIIFIFFGFCYPESATRAGVVSHGLVTGHYTLINDYQSSHTRMFITALTIIIPIIYLLVFKYYFTRPKVKEQFK